MRILKAEHKYAAAINSILKKINYSFVIKNLRGIGDFIEPWCDFTAMDKLFDQYVTKYNCIFKLLYIGKETTYNALIEEVDSELIDMLIECGFLIKENDIIHTNNFVVLMYQGIYLVVDINIWFPTCNQTKTEVYLGLDSLRLAENIRFDIGSSVLDLCSGSGVQGLLAAKSASSVVSVDINEQAINTSNFNKLLNGFSNIDIINGDLYNAIGDRTFDYIYANPPFIPMIDDVEYPVCGTGGEDGLRVLRKIIYGLPKHIKDNGESVIFCECLGDDENVFFNLEIKDFCQKNKLSVSCVLLSKGVLDYQVKTLAEITSLYNDDSFDETTFISRMKMVYSNLGAKHLYSILYRIHKVDDNPTFDIYSLVSNWNPSSTAKISENIEIMPNNKSHKVTMNNETVAYFDEQGLAVFNCLAKGITVNEVAVELYYQFKNEPKYKKYGFESFQNAVLADCLKLQNLNMISMNKQ